MPDSSATRLTVFVCYLACIGWVGGCASDTEAAPTPQDPVTMDASSGVPLDGGAPSKSDATHACLEGSAQSCTCPNGRGTRTCQSGVFGSCSECKTIDVQLPKCAAGHYEGAFEMRYRSGPSGVCGLFAQLDEGVAQGHWSFSLASSATADSYTVNAGCLTAGDSGATVPIYASITGSVECSSGKFLGELRGTYNSTSVCTLGVGREDSFFKGTMSGTYDPVTRSFLDTHVEWHEPAVAIPPQPGGEGSWTAVLTPDAGLSDGPVDCLHGVVFPEDKFPKSP